MMKSFEDHWPSGVSLTDFLSWPIRRLEDQMMMKMVVTVGGVKGVFVTRLQTASERTLGVRVCEDEWVCLCV